MINIRVGVFETNSSSVHSMVLCTADDYRDWLNGNKLYNVYYNNYWPEDKNGAPQFVTLEEAAQYDKHFPYPENHAENYYGGWDLEFQDENGNYCDRMFITAKEFERFYGYDFETFNESYTTPGGEEVIAFGYYGHD